MSRVLTALFIVVVATVAGCTTTSDPKDDPPSQCWAHESGANTNFKKDNAECSMVGDPAGAFLTGGVAAAVAAKRRYDFCMQSKGWSVVDCEPAR